LVPACWLMAMTLASSEVEWRGKMLGERGRRRIVVWTAAAAAVLLCLYAVAVVPWLQRRAKVKPIAAQIDQLVPNGEPLYALDPDYQPILFYVRSRLVYVSQLEDLPATARYLLIRLERAPEVMQSDRWLPLRPREVQRFTDYRSHTVVVARVGEQ